MAAKKPNGRPSTYDAGVAARICERLSDGEPLRQICRDDDMPPWRTVYGWMAADPELAARIAHARDLGGDAIAEDTLRIMDEPPERTATEHGDKVDSGYVQWQKNRVEQRMKLLAKWNPKKYGDKIALGGADDLPAMKVDANVVIDPSEAYKRLLGDG